MIQDDFVIDFENKKISHNGKGVEVYPITTFYSFLQDTFDEPENMRFDIPIEAKSKADFKLVNGWTIDEQAIKHLEGNLEQ